MSRVPDAAKREVWRRRLSEFDRGKATIAEFCRREAVAVSSFYRWRQNLEWAAPAAFGRHRQGTTQDRDARSDDRTRRVGAKPSLTFVPIEITRGPSIEVHLPNGTRVTVPCHDRDAIGAVIAALLTDSQERCGSSRAEGRPC